jgi:phage repressor protein C with HTH and peptisase S24 domain
MSPGETTLARMVREAREAADWTQEALAKAIGCSKGQLSLMESGQRTISPEWAAKIERALGIADGSLVAAAEWQLVPASLRERVEASQEVSRKLAGELRKALASRDPAKALRKIIERTRANIEDPLPLPRRIPVINKVAAGYPAEFTDLDYPVSIADEYIACPDVTDPSAFAARVVGDSMEPAYREGEIVVFSPVLPTPSGSDCFIRLERDNETTFKRIYLEDEGETIRLQPLNSRYPPRTVPREDISGMYAAAYVMRKV